MIVDKYLFSFFRTKYGRLIAFLPSLIFNHLLLGRKRKFYNQIEQCLFIGMLPTKRVILELVNQHQLKAILSVNEDFELKFSAPSKWLEKLNIQRFHLRCRDFDTPLDPYKIKEAVEFVSGKVEKNQSVYVHCKAGRGRSALVVLCFLMDKYNYNPQESLSYLIERRNHVKLGDNQMISLYQYYNTFIKKL